MNQKVSYTLVGLFVIVLGTALTAGAVWLSTAGSEVKYTTYVIYIEESVSGLNPNAAVTYNGVNIGRVTVIQLDAVNPQLVRVELEIESRVSIKEDTTAGLAVMGITGIAHVELRGGSIDSPQLGVDAAEGHPIIQTRPSLFTRLDTSITELIDQLNSAVNSLQNVADRIVLFLSLENQEAITAILAHVEDIGASTGRIALSVEGILEDVATTSSNVAIASGDLPGLLSTTNRTVRSYQNTAQSLSATGDAVSDTANAVTLAVQDLVVMFENIQADLAPLSRGVPAQLVQLISELQFLVGSLQRLVQDVERDPNMLLFGRPDTTLGPGE